MGNGVSSKEERIGVGSVDTYVTVRAILITGIRHVVLHRWIWIARTMKTEVARAVMAFETYREHDRPL
jgi:hypothetical protein